MSKMIAVWGTPNSGKTAFALKLAESIYLSERRRKPMIMVVLTDVISPSIPVLFPNVRSEDVYSIGDLLAKPTLSVDDVFSYMLSIRGKDNIGILGYKEKEHCHSHPEYTREKVKSLFSILLANTDYVIVDCMSDPRQSLLSDEALLESDQSIWMVTPDLKCMSYSLSQTHRLIQSGWLKPNRVAVINNMIDGVPMSNSDMRTLQGKSSVALPFSAALLEQATEGTMSEELRDRKFMNVVRMVAEAVNVGKGG